VQNVQALRDTDKPKGINFAVKMLDRMDEDRAFLQSSFSHMKKHFIYQGS
jgi:hypothetical protein